MTERRPPWLYEQLCPFKSRYADVDGLGVHYVSQGEPVAAQLPRTNHFGFRLTDEEAVRAAHERLSAARVPETESQDDGTFVRVQVAGPDGYRVELYA